MRREADGLTKLNAFPGLALLATALATLISFASTLAQPSAPASQQETSGSHLEKFVPFVPTPLEVVEKMLELAHVDADDVVYDLGSGDGRIVIMAAQKYGARAVGVELDPDLYQQSSARIKELGLEDRAKILHDNMFEVNVRRATVVTLYLLTSVNEHAAATAGEAASLRSARRFPRLPGSRLERG